MKKIGKKSLFLYFFFVMLISIVAVFSVACDSQETELPVIEDVSFSTESIYVEYGDSSLEENIKGYIQNLPQDATVQFEGLFDLAVGEYPITVNISMDGYQTLSLSVVLVIGKATYNFEDIVFNAKDALWTGETIAIPTIEGDLPYYVNVTYTSNPSPIVEEGVYTVIANFTSTNPNIELTKTSMFTTLTVKRQYVVTVNTNGGVGCESEYKVYNGEYLTLPTPEKEDYIFKGWQKDGVSFNVNAPIVENVELEAVWEPIKYTISYELNSQNMSVNNSENPTEYTHLDEEITLKNPVCEGLNFAGWYTDVECTAPIEKIDPQGRKEITVYAKWTPVVYTINYELDGGENNSENPTEFTVFDYVQFNNPTRENYAFMGWYEDSECNNRVIILSERASDITLYAKWEPRKYMIQYYLNGGKNDDRNPKYFTHLDEGEIVLYAPTKAGYVFDGWYTENYFKNIITTIDTDVLKAYNLYAKWIELDVVFTISPIDESTATLIGIKAKSEITKVEIPSEYDGYAITAIGDATNSVMKNSAHVTSVTIPASVSSINANAFKSSGLTEMSIPNTVTSIGNYAFAYNYELSDVNWSTGALSISSYTFLDCKKLTSFEIPNTVTYIGMKSFKGTGLTEIIIPDSVTDIMSEAFENLALTKAVVGKNVTYMSGAFVGCNKLEELTIPFVGGQVSSNWNATPLYQLFYKGSYNERPDYSKNETYVPASLKKVVVTNSTTLKDESFRACANIQEVVLPEGMTTIGQSAFYGCTNILTFTLPSTVISVGRDAFLARGGFVEVYNLSKLTLDDLSTSRINYCVMKMHTSSQEPSIIQTVGDYKFAVVDDKYTLVKYRGDSADITLPTLDGGKTYEVGGYSMRNGEFISVVIPNCVTSINEYAFSFCQSLSSVTFPTSSLVNIGEYAFTGTSLESVVIPDSVTSMGRAVFSAGYTDGNKTLKSVVLGNGLTEVVGYAFENCLALESVTFGENIVTIWERAFSNTAIKELVLNQKVEKIASAAFSYCKSLTHVKLSQSLTYIDYDSFSNCNIKEIWNPSVIELTIGETNHGNIAEKAEVIHTNLTDDQEVFLS